MGSTVCETICMTRVCVGTEAHNLWSNAYALLNDLTTHLYLAQMADKMEMDTGVNGFAGSA